MQPFLRPYAVWLKSWFPQLTVTSVYRSFSEQARLYRQAQQGRSRYPAAPPGFSKHQRGLAWDMEGEQDQLQEAGELWRRMGGRWFESDPIHFEV